MFKGKSLGGEGWVEGDLLTEPEHEYICCGYITKVDGASRQYIVGETYEVDPDTVELIQDCP